MRLVKKVAELCLFLKQKQIKNRGAAQSPSVHELSNAHVLNIKVYMTIIFEKLQPFRNMQNKLVTK